MKKSFGRAWLPLLVVIIVGVSLAFYRTKTEKQRTADTFRSEVETTIHDILRTTQDEQGVPVVSDLQIDTTPKTQGNLGELERLIKTQMNKSLEIQNAYLIRLEKIGFNNLFDETRLQQDHDFSQSRSILAETRLAIKDTHNLSLAEIKSLSDKVNALDVDNRFKADMLQGVRQAFPRSEEFLNLVWSLEMQGLDEITAIIDLLEARKGSWSFHDGEILFESDQDSETANIHFNKMNEIFEQQMAAQQHRIDSVLKHLEK